MINLTFHTIDKSIGKYRVSEPMLKRIIEQGRNCRLMFDDGYEAIYNVLKDFGPEVCQRTYIFCVVGKIGGCNDWDSGGELCGRRLLSWEQIRKLKSLGVTIGSHGLNHVDLRALDNGPLKMELFESKRILEERIGGPVASFSYPYGYFDGRVIAVAKEAGYQWAYTTSSCIWEGIGNPYRKRRIAIDGRDSPGRVWMKLSGFYDLKAVWELPVLVAEKVKLHFRARHG